MVETTLGEIKRSMTLWNIQLCSREGERGEALQCVCLYLTCPASAGEWESKYSFYIQYNLPAKARDGWGPYGVSLFSFNVKREIFLDFHVFHVQYSTLLHLPPLRFRCVNGCWI